MCAMYLRRLSSRIAFFGVIRFSWKDYDEKKGGIGVPIVNVGFQVIPKTKEGNSYELVDKAIEVVSKSGVKYEVDPMETVMEGEYDKLMEIVKEAQEAVIAAGAQETMTFIKVHYRPEGVTIDEKVAKYR